MSTWQQGGGATGDNELSVRGALGPISHVNRHTPHCPGIPSVWHVMDCIKNTIRQGAAVTLAAPTAWLLCKKAVDPRALHQGLHNVSLSNCPPPYVCCCS